MNIIPSTFEMKSKNQQTKSFELISVDQLAVARQLRLNPNLTFHSKCTPSKRKSVTKLTIRFVLLYRQVIESNGYKS